MPPSRSLSFVGAAILATAATAHADRGLLSIGGGASTRGPTAAASLAFDLAALSVSARVDLAAEEGEVMVGLRPYLVTAATVSTRWQPHCLAEPGRRCTTQALVREPGTASRVVHRLTPAAGVRRSLDRTTVLAALQLHPSDDLLGDRIEVGVTGVAAGTDRMFVQHAGFVPGWFLRAQVRVSHVVIGGELGATGIAGRGADGGYRPDAYAVATLGVAVGL